MGIATNNLQSFRPYHPGELIKEELECRGIRQKDFGCQCRFACKNAN